MKMRNNVQSLTGKHIVSESDVREFIHSLINDFELGFNPDNDFSDYINYGTGKATFNKVECKNLDMALNECWEVCKKFDLCIYDISMEIMLVKHPELKKLMS